MITSAALVGPRIYESLKITTKTSLRIIGINGTLALLYTTITLACIDRVGRVKPMFLGALGCGVAMLVEAILSTYFPGATSSNSNALRARVPMAFVIGFFFVGLGVNSWVYPSEIFPTNIRAKGNYVTTFTNGTTGLVFAQISPTALGNIGFKYFYVFFAFNMISATCFYCFYPETKGLTLEQLDSLFGDQLVPHALQDPETARAVMDDKVREGEVHEEIV
jgi:MFS family permease